MLKYEVYFIAMYVMYRCNVPSENEVFNGFIDIYISSLNRLLLMKRLLSLKRHRLLFGFMYSCLSNKG